MNYKKVFRTSKSRQTVLNMLRFVPDSIMLPLQYRVKFGRKLHLKNPVRFTEKLQWYKMHYRDPLMHQCADKYLVRDYVRRKGLESILIPLIAKYDTPDDVEWDKLPDRFVIKTKERLAFNPHPIKKNSAGREWAYYGLQPGIVVEKLLINHENPEAGINDYKIYCYAGIPKYIHVDIDRRHNHRRNFYDADWNKLDLESEYPNWQGSIEKPCNLSEMLRIAGVLSSGFPFVRVDLYNTEGKIYFGEMTFYPSSGYAPHDPDEWDYKFGEGFELRKFE